ncbi:MAG: flagellar motor protein MotB [Pseudomonadota bacterium]
MSDVGVTIIKKRKIVQEAGHHGGAWKVAYADFVTAMMAFFLLMWLLNATSEEQRQGIADYFAPAIPIHRQGGGGDGAFGGDTIYADEELVRNGTGAERMHASEDNEARGDLGHAPDLSEKPEEMLDTVLVEQLFRAAAGEVLKADETLSHIETTVSDEGLIIDIFERDGAPIFASGSAEPEPRLVALLEVVGQVLALVTNDLAISGHTDGRPFARADYSNWELSADRAHAVRRLLTERGVAEGRIARITGEADRAPMTDDPLDSRNRRIVITVLRSDITLK